MQVDIIPKTFAELQNEATPQAVEGGNMEAVAWSIYDTATYTSAATTALTFFNTTRANPQLSNLAPAGQFPNPQFFRVQSATLDVMELPGASAVQAAVLDTWQILFGTGVAGIGAPVFMFVLANKQYGPFPLSMCHGTGGPQGFGYTGAVAAGVEWAVNSFPDGGFKFGNSILIPPQQAFQVTAAWDGPVTLTANINLRFALHGTLYRRIL